MIDFTQRRAQIGLGVIVVAAGMIAPMLFGNYTVMLLSRFLAMAIVALGIGLIWGQGGVLSLGQGVFFGLGGYALAMHMKLAGVTAQNLPDFMVWSGVSKLPLLWLPFRSGIFSILAVVLVPGVIAAGFSWAVFRRRIGGVYFALITQALALAFATLLVSEPSLTGGFNGLTNFSTLFGFSTTSDGFALGLYYATLGGTALA
ncbi:MAG: urea ABC transporter permease subunit UrtC, partial [Acidocella sp.]|nr:urea ABC transporter permease subunit UrtC [Acidocella sp.]